MYDTCLNSSCADFTAGPIGQLFASSVQFLFAAQCMINEKWPPDASNYIQDLTFDYIVVGGGTAGSVVASRLSEESCRRVLLVEAGEDPPLESLVPSAVSEIPTKYIWKYQSENDSRICQLSFDGRCHFYSGKMLGGVTSLNGLSFDRGNRQDYDDLEKAGNTGWNYDTVLKYFKKSENLNDEFIRNNDRLSIYHNYDGLFGVSISRLESSVSDTIIKGYLEAGYEYNDDPNGRYQMGSYRVHQIINDGVRESTARAFLVPASGRPNLIVLKNALVTKIVTRNKRATGVLISLQNGTVIEANAVKEVIISAGAIGSPQLLMLSGIGPRDHLSTFNIPVIADLPVGKNLLSHTAVRLEVKIQPALPQREEIADALNYLAYRRGYLGELGFFGNTRGSLTGAFITTNNTIYDIDLPNFQIFTYAGDQVIEFEILYLDSPSRGDIQLLSTDPFENPRINLNFYHYEIDIENWLKAFSFVMQLINTPSLKSINTTYVPDPACGSFEHTNDYWTCFLYRYTSLGYRFRGTTKMGPRTDIEAVVNPKLQVYGIKSLRVVDGGIIPGVIRGGTMGPVIMIGERASDLIQEAYINDVC